MVDRAPKVPRAQVSGAFSLAVTGNFCGECPVFWSGSCRDAKISTLGGVFPNRGTFRAHSDRSWARLSVSRT